MYIASFGTAASLLLAITIAAAEPLPPTPVDASPQPVAAPSPPLENETNQEAMDEDRSVYLSLSPLHLILPVVEVMGEARVHRKIGVAVIGGYGSVTVSDLVPSVKVWEVGGQFVGYPVGHFDHGMQLGLEVLYAGASTSYNRVSATELGLASGPFIGYKLATRVGFSFNVQAGVQYVFAKGEASSTSGAMASAEQADVVPLVNLNVGWSF